MIKTKWLFYTVIIGLIPFFVRSLIFLFDKTASVAFWLNETDFILFGLVLNLTNINELENKEFEDKKWKTRNIGISVVFIVVLATIFAIVTYSDFKVSSDINKPMVKGCSFGFALVSFVISYSIYDRLNKLNL